jgi:hypothetical protein
VFTCAAFDRQHCVLDAKFNEAFFPDIPASVSPLPSLSVVDLFALTSAPPASRAAMDPCTTGTTKGGSARRTTPLLRSLVFPHDSPLVRVLKQVFACPVPFGTEVFIAASGLVSELLSMQQDLVRGRVEATGVVHALLGCIVHRALPMLTDLGSIARVLKSIRTVPVYVLLLPVYDFLAHGSIDLCTTCLHVAVLTCALLVCTWAY